MLLVTIRSASAEAEADRGDHYEKLDGLRTAEKRSGALALTVARVLDTRPAANFVGPAAAFILNVAQLGLVEVRRRNCERRANGEQDQHGREGRCRLHVP